MDTRQGTTCLIVTFLATHVAGFLLLFHTLVVAATGSSNPGFSDVA